MLTRVNPPSGYNGITALLPQGGYTVVLPLQLPRKDSYLVLLS